MRIVRIDNEGKDYGIIESDSILMINDGRIKSVDLKEAKLLPPCEMTKAVCVGLNYGDHIEEMGDKRPDEPTLFIKPATAAIGYDDYIVIPKMSERVDYEGELAVVMKKTAKDVSEDEALDYVLGYTIANDVTARDLQSKDGQWTRAKSFDTFLPIGPWIETDLDPSNLEIKTYVNGILKQHSNTKHLIFSVPKLVSFISHVMTLNPGDVILTGTPSGVGPIKSGDVVTIEIEGIGKLTNKVK
ncbi:fumarylacetoacetate hydrolase family protein [Thermoanaerobacterium butyriciformans]|uniref:2-keto-4-pentenoate hydratase/2-oxohepta-3-ene-1,7-dioic acid hydratase in catechol pathway n=1 Tax=Thermoanaerobacterium butyriciformans TaxID=1702242 RepID=A0ABS4NB98_9THEO|nr:fumarylacetoacetate hydrolase family protein [Thermoanaerobacterium butyriciformans]MBP2070931.1 2-keto-4-pentenoate hydratase/2-oxohepta-3-ene-1,7-dioic acid hydratase in catechol pathway [Thermoanaerobacterium butyriciformans]